MDYTNTIFDQVLGCRYFFYKPVCHNFGSRLHVMPMQALGSQEKPVRASAVNHCQRVQVHTFTLS